MSFLFHQLRLHTAAARKRERERLVCSYKYTVSYLRSDDLNTLPSPSSSCPCRGSHDMHQEPWLSNDVEVLSQYHILCSTSV